MTLRLLTFACWTIFMLYWLYSARSVKPIEKTAGWLSGSWYTILVLVGFAFIFRSRPSVRLGIPVDILAQPILLQSSGLDILCAIVLFTGLIIAIAARHTLAGNWSSQVAIKEGHELITTGLYSHIRNPIYTGILLMVLGTVLCYGTVGSLIGFLIIALAIYLKLSSEEKILGRQFGATYTAYRQRTKALIPFVW